MSISCLLLSYSGNNCINQKMLCVCRSMPQLVAEVVKGVQHRLDRPALHVADEPVDLEERVAQVKQRLAEIEQGLADDALGGAAVLGLHGMGGIGKTTLAMAVFNALRSDFAGSCCFLEVGQHASGPALDLQRLQRQMLKDLCNIDGEIHNVAEGKAKLASLRDRRVLVIMDDIWSAAQRDALLVPLGPGSCVVLTTRNAQLLTCADIPSQPVEVLNRQAAFQLFCRYAFRARTPPAGHGRLAAEAVTVCAGLPLTLKVVGAYLRDQHDCESWLAALARLRAAEPLSGGRTEDDELWGRLKVSFDALGGPEKEMFLDIACCMLGKIASAVLPAWGPWAKATLRNLTSKSLLVVGNSGRLAMHDQLRAMARAIVVMENSQQPALRSRVWLPEALHLVYGKQVGAPFQTSVHGKLKDVEAKRAALCIFMYCSRRITHLGLLASPPQVFGDQIAVLVCRQLLCPRWHTVGLHMTIF